MDDRMTRAIFAPCPGCHNDITLDHMPKLGAFVTCPTCGDLVEVISLSPFTLDWSAEIDDEAWPDDEDDFGDFGDDYRDDFVTDFDEDFVD